MGNCSMKAVTDAAAQEDGAVRTASTNSPFDGRTKTTPANRKTSPRSGVWKVKLVIDPKDLERILSEEVNTEALIEQMRFAANSTPVRGKSKSSWGEAIYHKCACSPDRTVRHRRSHLR